MDNAILKQLNNTKPREFSGSKTINAYSFQLDICAYLILEMLKQNDDFIVLVDYLDDIVVLDDATNPTSIIFYQVKSSKNEITMSQIINNSWLAYMETNLNDFKGTKARSIFLTNSTIEFSKKGFKTNKSYSFTDYSLIQLKQFLETSCTKEDQSLIENRIHSTLKDVGNYENLYISRTKFTIADHENQLLAELTNYLQTIDSKLDLVALKSIYDGFISKLRCLGKETYNPPIFVYDDLKAAKGFTKSDLDSIYHRIKNLMIPIDFNLIYDFAQSVLNHIFNGNYLSLKNEYRDFGIAAQRNSATYNLILNRISQIDVSKCTTLSLFDYIRNELEIDNSINSLEFYKKYFEFIIIVFIYKV